MQVEDIQRLNQTKEPTLNDEQKRMLMCCVRDAKRTRTITRIKITCGVGLLVLLMVLLFS